MRPANSRTSPFLWVRDLPFRLRIVAATASRFVVPPVRMSAPHSRPEPTGRRLAWMASPARRPPSSEALVERSHVTTPVPMADVRPLGPPVMSTEPLLRISWSRYFAALRRYKWLILAILVVGTALGSASRACWLRCTRSIPRSGFRPRLVRRERATPIRAGEAPRETSWPELLTSFAILEGVVRQMSLYVIPEEPADTPSSPASTPTRVFAPANTSSRSKNRDGNTRCDRRWKALQTGIVGDSIGRALGFQWKPPPSALRPGRASGSR